MIRYIGPSRKKRVPRTLDVRCIKCSAEWTVARYPVSVETALKSVDGAGCSYCGGHQVEVCARSIIDPNDGAGPV